MSISTDWPSARPPAGDRAVLKAVPEDFRVVELPAFEFEGAGEHLLLRVQKIGRGTAEVARDLARALGVADVAVGYAGMKDKDAVTEQWFSVHTPRGAADLAPLEGVRVLEEARHRRKLRRGELAGNAFEVRLRHVVGDQWNDRLEDIRCAGVPNYFGPQRFGTDNLANARSWLANRRRQRVGAFRSGLYLSVLRSYLFNETLAARVRDGSWNRPLGGDVMMPLPASLTEPAGPALRCAATGPLWGRGRSPVSDVSLAVERAALAPHREICLGLEHAGLTQQRRSLELHAVELSWQRQGDDLELSFALPPGGYATTLLGDAFDLALEHGRP